MTGKEPSSGARRLSIQFPIIPPLPSSSVLGKENTSETPFRSREVKVKRTPSTHTRLPLRENSRQKDNYMSPGLLSFSDRKDRVLRTAESAESLFCLSTKSSKEHRNLCRHIADGTYANDSNKWYRALKVAIDEVVTSQDSSNPIAISDLIRLLRRAKSRFSIIDHKSKVSEDDVLFIWLSYAEILGKYVSSDEARGIYRLIQSQGFRAENQGLYPTLAKFESWFKKPRAFGPTNDSLTGKGASCQSDVQYSSSITHASPPCSSLAPKSANSPVRSPLLDATKRSNLVPPLPLTSAGGHKRPQSQVLSPKRQRRICETQIGDNNNVPDYAENWKRDTNPESATGREKPHQGARVRNNTSDIRVNNSAAASSQKEEVALNYAVKDSSLLQRNKQSAILNNQRMKSSLLPKASRLKSVGLSGGAKRLTPEDSVLIDESDDEKMEVLVSTKSTQKNNLSSEFSNKSARKTLKMDLSYMMNWDPSKRGSFPSSTDCDITKKTNAAVEVLGSGGTNVNKAIDTMGTGLKGDTGKITSSHVTSSTSSSHTGRSANSNESRDSDTTGRTNNNRKQPEDSNSVPSPENLSLIAQCSSEFLPLVQQKNIIKVNSASYVKLGVMGKGGSSKVYRALAKDYSVVAIKKVKLAHLDQKAIDGYANEISLLKKLRGNPAIIQLYDSEVDMKRKAIFLVMEIGEVDLNYVLQQKVLQSNNGNDEKEPRLNINFIRLTWQQMLSAVHSIHEERIIHSDLKPANFLFVRGTLKLIDFGIAKAIQNEDTTNIYRDSQIGTLNYMSPEAILDTGSENGEARMKIGRASDIWSLGCILYQMVFGRTPFASLHMIQKMQAIVNPAHKIPFPGEADEAAVDAIKKCLRRTPENRPPIIGKDGLLNEHYFLNYGMRCKT
mmetsp:Transcript_14147/g.20894  ORF Transcript_14147/g.20894 Transcript_14147/m.20894 type:complete len:897 (-) Transcript_14147:426-3116(-)|eukprot:CAMPEP_0194220494 /NCGR_PEP_ID=MMETSP0156-20130528/28538_1 /TAXON_ID=33649 /ORGANISM="Thalassionema nitzschioides, Strain L26-B" /LENGTH=896 /DNA_ID=CAMNT_0038950559 /DNA_START=24 /DNA_END=2714 /DNA_ORIENTATION=+